MHTVSVARSMEGQTTFLEHSQHCQVFRQDFRDELVEPGLAGNRREVTHQCRPNSLPLVGVDYSEGNLGLPRFQQNVAPTTSDYWLVVFFCDGNQGHVTCKIHVEKERSFLLRKVAFGGKEAAIEGLSACLLNGGLNGAAIVGPKAADFDLQTAAQDLEGGISRCI